jgi:K+-transporting ATPase ATPase C chain
MTKLLRPALTLLGLLSVLTGLVYPLAVTGLSRVALPGPAGGSLITEGGAVRGSSLIGQAASGPAYFWGRPSATGGKPYDAASSSGSNLGPSNPALLDAVRERIAALRAADPGNTAPVPVDLVTASASGLDPHLSPAGALFQVARVARARHLDEARVRQLVAAHTEGRTLGVLGEPRVNVLDLNRALDHLSPGGA